MKIRKKIQGGNNEYMCVLQALTCPPGHGPVNPERGLQ